jgi:hypothetical protein
MTRDRHEDDDEQDANLDNRDLPDESDMDSFDEPSLMPCPYCRQLISEEAEICPHCRNYLSSEDAPRHPPAWLVVGAIVTIITILIVWVVKGR